MGGEPLNEFQKLRDVADDTYIAQPTINNETPHVMGRLDLAAEPVIVTVPDIDEGRYWILHTMDMGRSTSTMVGSHTRCTAGGRFVFAKQRWEAVPDGITNVARSESNIIELMSRVMVVDASEDLKMTRAVMDGWTLDTLLAGLGLPARNQSALVPGPSGGPEQCPVLDPASWM